LGYVSFLKKFVNIFPSVPDEAIPDLTIAWAFLTPTPLLEEMLSDA
jgi:hypothetical protein